MESTSYVALNLNVRVNVDVKPSTSTTAHARRIALCLFIRHLLSLSSDGEQAGFADRGPPARQAAVSRRTRR